MKKGYTDERNAQILISLMKKNGIKKVVASPGATNICFVASLQYDPYFEIYSAADERSAAYIACGLAAESGETVALSCTGATSSRNYMPALTEAYYRKLPILVITSSRRSERIGHNIDQVTDRTLLPRDVAKMSVQMPLIHDYESEWADVVAANKAILELNHHGKGPVHINLETNYSKVYSTQPLPDIRSISRVSYGDEFPSLGKYSRIAIMVGSHTQWSENLTKVVDIFCKNHNAIVLCDHCSNYKGKYRVLANLITQQYYYNSVIKSADFVIHIGSISASNYGINMKKVWRVCEDGEIRDTYKKLRVVFEMTEEKFFNHYSEVEIKEENAFYRECQNEISDVQNNIPEIPFSNAWIASVTADKLPQDSVIHFGILNSLRTWNYFEIPQSCMESSNTGGFGIDGSLSTIIGAALANKEIIHYCVLGDLAFFYDMNALGNHNVGNNVRILLVNNGRGTEFRLSGSQGRQFEEDCDSYIAAAGHYGNKSKKLVRHYAEDLGFEYYSAETKEEFLNILPNFIDPNLREKSAIFEVFTDSENENTAMVELCNIKRDQGAVIKSEIVGLAKDVLKPEGIKKIKRILGK